jgi:hypothetical protein
MEGHRGYRPCWTSLWEFCKPTSSGQAPQCVWCQTPLTSFTLVQIPSLACSVAILESTALPGNMQPLSIGKPAGIFPHWANFHVSFLFFYPLSSFENLGSQFQWEGGRRCTCVSVHCWVRILALSSCKWSFSQSWKSWAITQPSPTLQVRKLRFEAK